MSHPEPADITLDAWIARESIPGALDDLPGFAAAVDRLLALLGPGVELLGLGETLHGGEEILLLRNRLFARLVAAHGFSAIAVESSFPRGRLVNEYVAGRGPDAYADVQEPGFSHGFGRLDANRDLVEWMRTYNADPAHPVKLHFYGFDSPTEMVNSDSPRQLLTVGLDYLAEFDPAASGDFRRRMDALIGEDAAWENPAAMMDPTQAIGLTPAATALRIETEELMARLQVHRPDLVALTGADRFAAAVQHVAVARQLLNYHAELARTAPNRTANLLAIRDAIMADNLAYIHAAEQPRGKVLVFAHNSHLRRSRAEWQLGPDLLVWWPVGAHLQARFGPRYAVVGTGVGTSADNGIPAPEPGTLEARLTAAPGPLRFIPTHRGEGLPVAGLPTRSGSTRNYSYFPFTPQSLADFDALAVLDDVGYTRGGPPLP